MVMFGLSVVLLLVTIDHPICEPYVCQFSASKTIRFVIRYRFFYNVLLFIDLHHIHTYHILAGVSSTVFTVSILQYVYQLPCSTKRLSRFDHWTYEYDQ